MVLRKIRITLAVISFLLITLLFLDFTGILHTWFGWLARIQLVPALLAMNTAVLLALAVLTLIFGRIYCSVVCPLGVLQDGISYISGKRKGKKLRFRFSKTKAALRYGVLAAFLTALFTGINLVVSLLEPYSAYGRIATNLLAPVYRVGNNLLAGWAERVDSYAFYSTDVWMKGGITLGIAFLTLIVVGILAWRGGRTYCNTICPVGTLLGFLSRFSLFRPAFDSDKCTKCGVCEKSCKASCINSKKLIIDQSRCVTCFNCIEKCKFGAMQYTLRRTGNKGKPANNTHTSFQSDSVNTGNKEALSRRNFLTISGLVAFTHTLKAQQLQVDGGLAAIEDKKVPVRKTRVLPPGAQGLRNMQTHCTACQLCVSACPNQILRPSAKLDALMQPEMSFERGFCRPECTECSQVCPTGAIQTVTTAEKSAVSIGQAVWVKENCVVNTNEVQCTACQSHCPTGAITLLARDPEEAGSLKVPVVDKELCIGCGACEYLCPARPFSAIFVEGYTRHHSV